ncbi:MAG TPA: aldo/keto reductase, partial [Actinomycetales bacterium]
MKTTTLGRSGLQVSRIAFGTWSFGGDWGSVDTDAAQNAIRYARELGVNFFDTAQGYGNGTAEEILGDALRSELDAHREEIVIATKGGIDPGAER